MITNHLIKLDCQSKERIDAENFIKYTLLFDYNLPDFNIDSSQVIKEILDKTQACCCNLFSSTNQAIYDFFGLMVPKKHDSLLYKLTSSCRENTVRLHDLILQNCIMSAYHAILTEYLSSINPISSYTLNDFKNGGAYSAIQKGAISLSKDKIILSNKKLRNTALPSQNKSGKASDFNKKFNCRFNYAPLNMSFLCPNSQTGNDTNYLPQFATLSNSITKIAPVHFKYLSNTQNANISDEIIENFIASFINNLTPEIENFSIIPNKSFSDFGRNVVDGMYQYYIAEKAYNFNLFYSILFNIKQTEKNQNYELSTDELLKTLSSCKKLPNSFSRTYFLRFAFDHISDECCSYIDYWLSHDIDRRNIAVSDTSQLPKGFQLDKWRRQFDQFINYMSDHVIPVYDWCFLTMLLHIIERAHPEQNHILHLEEALHTLSKYITENYQSIMQPIKIDNTDSMDGIDIISPKKIHELKYNFETTMEKFYKTFFSSFLNIELNIKPIDLHLYKGNNRKGFNTISDFYCNLRFGYK